MDQKYAQRPHFYEGQYLGAEDFNSLQDYLRDKQRRHLLGAHSWGIVSGLELAEQESGNDTVVYLQPGHAVDGYGRSVTVTSPYLVSPDLFGGQTKGLIKVWLRIREVNQAQNRRSYDACCGEDCYEAIVESFEIGVGDKEKRDERHSGIDIAGSHIVDPRKILDEEEQVSAVCCDASIPQQKFPATEDKPYWYIPLGMLLWDGSRLQPRSQMQLVSSRAFRRISGLIGENLYAADGLLRLRARQMDKTDSETVDQACQAQGINDSDMSLAAGGDGFSFNELVWIEGDLRITGDARLFGTRLEFRGSRGEQEPPLYARRGVRHEADIEITLGKESSSQAKRNDTRLVIGTRTDTAAGADIKGKVYITAAGKVGIGTGQPQKWDDRADALVIDGDGKVGLTIAGSDTGSLCFATGAEPSRLARGRVSYSHGSDSLVLGAGDIDHLWLSADGKLGIKTDKPSVPLHVTGGRDVTLASGSGFLLLGETTGANIVMDDNEIQARNNGAVSTLHLQAEGGGVQFNTHQAASRIIVTGGGRIGIGTSNPAIPLHIVNGRDSDLSSGSGFLLMGRTSGENMVLDNNEIQARNNGSASALYLQKEGGELRIGQDGRYHAVGSRQKGLAIVSASISSSGAIISGGGIQTPGHPATGRYTITFLHPFSTVPAVIVSPVNSSDSDNLLTVRILTVNGCEVRAKDTTPGSEGNLQDTAFTLIAIGT